ncbi:hypothetical protein CHS0354_006836 [Potamilus streckersoni]|uniref:Uncharacterized protein n=1 Tax=Potamilus streckersoni TaxID=2493646 RepID=A0AAE0TE84_9BIVA|nr:hypothetical protein CHS0354_006836 [Potamilus streckersoni]
MTALLIRYYSADDIIRFSLREDIQFKELLYKRYFNDFLGDLRAGKINRMTAKNFVGLFSFVNDPNLDHVLIYTYEKKQSGVFRSAEKTVADGGLYIPSGSTHYTQKDADEIRRRAGQKDWEAHYAGKYNLREYKYIRTTIKDAIRTVQTSSYYPEKLYYIYFKTLFRTRNYREFLNELFSARFGLLFGNYDDLVYDALASYLRLEEFEKADMLIQTLEKTSIAPPYARVKDAFHAFAEIDDSKLDQESVEELRWYLLHIKLAANKNDEAFRDSLDYYEKTNDPSISSGYCYWSVKLHLAKGKNYTGTDCVDKYTNYYYGVKTSQLIPRRNLFEPCREESLNAVRQVNDDMVLEWYDLLKSEEGKSTADLMFSRNDSKISVYQLNQIAKRMKHRRISIQCRTCCPSILMTGG